MMNLQLKRLIWVHVTAWSIALGLTLSFVLLSKFLEKNPPASESIQVPLPIEQMRPEKDQEGALKPRPITFLFTGDVMLGRYIQTLIPKKGGDFPFTHMPGIIAKVEEGLGVDSLDFVAANVEGPISDSKYVNPGTAMRFNFKPETANMLAKAGFNTANMANNHTLDQGEDYFRQTYDYLTAAGILAFGHQDKANGEWTFASKEVAGQTIGFLGFNDAVTRLDQEAALQKIQEIDPQVDFLVIAVHWGIEYEKTARPSVVELAHKMVDNGADFIWGTHPHVVQNRETYKEVPIYYSLGNFVFDQYWSEDTQKGLVVGLAWEEGEPLKVVEVPVDLVNQGEPKVRE